MNTPEDKKILITKEEMKQILEEEGAGYNFYHYDHWFGVRVAAALYYNGQEIKIWQYEMDAERFRKYVRELVRAKKLYNC
ncbi:MAG: hypothetical protein QG620_118 [Patescibacteria group bacterium]|nr:hypothetical protein [Patescibacteria group bacterium]